MKLEKGIIKCADSASKPKSKKKPAKKPPKKR